MRKKIPCKVVESAPLTVCSQIVSRDIEFVSCGDDLRINKSAPTVGTIIYTSRLNITNISDIGSSKYSVFDAYF